MTKEKGGGGGRLGHFSPSGGRVRDDVACPVRCPIMKIITGTCTGTAQTPNPGIKCGYTLHRAVQEFRKTDKYKLTHTLNKGLWQQGVLTK